MSKPSTIAKYCHDPIPAEDIKRFYNLELRFHENPALEGELRKVAERLRSKMLPAFKEWVEKSNTHGRAEVDKGLVFIYELLKVASSTRDLVVAVDSMIHAQHVRGIFIAEMSPIKDKSAMKEIGMDLAKFRNPDMVEWKPLNKWAEEGIHVA